MASDYLISDFSGLSTVSCLSPTSEEDPNSSEKALLQLMERTGYSMIQQNGQRKYGGPPPGWDGPAPPRGCEVFVGRIPRDCYEDELVPIFETVGKIYELRLMMDFSGANRGYAFVTYTNKTDAQRSVREMNNYEIRKGRFLGVCLSVDNCRLFVGGIPKTKTRDEIMEEMVKVTEGVVDVIVYPSATDKSKNRGFAFVEYDSHRAAAMARRKLIPGRIQLWGHQIAVDWAEPENEVDEDIMKTVKILYVRNLMLSTTEEHLEEVFTKAAEPFAAGKKPVERVKKLKDYAFIHFSEREEALRALQALNGKEIDGSRVEVVLAKPVDKNDPTRQKKQAANQQPLLANPFLPNMIPAFDPNTLNAYYAQFSALPGSDLGFPTAMSATTSMANRAGVARPTIRGGRGRGAAGSRAASARIYGNRKKPPSPSELLDPVIYSQNPGAAALSDSILQGQGLSVNPYNSDYSSATTTATTKAVVQVLERICQMNGWGVPVYQLNSATTSDGTKDVQLFLFKVVIPGLANSTPTGGAFIPNKVCRTVDEAQNYAAEYVLMSMGVPYDGSTGLMPSGMPGMITPAMQLPLGAINYLGQHITAGQMPAMPAANGQPDLAALTAAYSMHGVPGIPTTGSIVPTSQQIYLNGDLTAAAVPMQNATDLANTLNVGSPTATIPAAPFTQY